MLGGIAIGFLGPLEMYCFHLFPEGERFSYEDFGLDSFMFGNIASQAISYYLTAEVLIVVGYGQLFISSTFTLHMAAKTNHVFSSKDICRI